MLAVRDIHAYHGDSYTLQGVSLTAHPGACLGVLGRNGAGKTTLMHCIVGLHRTQSGTVTLDGNDLTRASSPRRIAAGLALVPQGRRIFPSLTVEENLRVVPASAAGKLEVDDIYSRFPGLAQRRRHMGNELSGGEQQMLAIGRALMSNPTYLLLDEPTEGLAPAIVDEVARVIAGLVNEDRGVVLVEQGLQFVLDLASTICVMDHGSVVISGDAESYRADPTSLLQYLGIIDRASEHGEHTNS